MKKDFKFMADCEVVLYFAGVDKPYEVYVNASSPGSRPMRYYINVCGELGIQCPDDESVRGVAVCQTMVGNSSWGHVLGKTDHQELK